MKNLYIFDLDGTLIDSKSMISNCFKKVLNELLPNNSYKTDNLLIGPSLHDTAGKLLGHHNHQLIGKFKEKLFEIHDNHLLKEI